MQITTDGITDDEWDVEEAKWSPDSLHLAVKKVDSRTVPSMPIVHWLKPQEEVEWIHYSRAGEPIPRIELYIIDIVSKKQVRVDAGNEADQYLRLLGWRSDGSELLFCRMNREFTKLDLLSSNPATGSTRVVLTETRRTFLVGLDFMYADWAEWGRSFTSVGDGRKFVWMSERDEWNHLYLYDLGGNLLGRLTEGSFPVVRTEAVDEKAQWVYFTAHGNRQRPYDTHLYRVSLAGRGFRQLTEEPGVHRILFAPSKEFFLDTHSTVDRPPAVALRRADGTLLQTLSSANGDALSDLKWKPPEEFVVKAADGKTDLYGVFYKPYDFDPNRKYPVIEVIYAGPYVAVATHSFIPQGFSADAQALAQLGFVTFVVDARGTPNAEKRARTWSMETSGAVRFPTTWLRSSSWPRRSLTWILAVWGSSAIPGAVTLRSAPCCWLPTSTMSAWRPLRPWPCQTSAFPSSRTWACRRTTRKPMTMARISGWPETSRAGCCSFTAPLTMTSLSRRQCRWQRLSSGRTNPTTYLSCRRSNTTSGTAEHTGRRLPGTSRST